MVVQWSHGSLITVVRSVFGPVRQTVHLANPTTQNKNAKPCTSRGHECIDSIDSFLPNALMKGEQKPQAHLACRYRDKNGEERVTGTESLKASQSYPERILGLYSTDPWVTCFGPKLLCCPQLRRHDGLCPDTLTSAEAQTLLDLTGSAWFHDLGRGPNLIGYPDLTFDDRDQLSFT